jgi:glycerol-3-phosphate acyltransferase PlsX
MRIVEPDKYNGALLLGLDGLVVKSHGNCNALSFETALHQAFNIAQQPVIEKMTKILENS